MKTSVQYYGMHILQDKIYFRVCCTYNTQLQKLINKLREISPKKNGVSNARANESD